jgi:lipoate---protein ligase
MPEELRIIDFGQVSPLRSQTAWHAVAYGVSDGAPATLSFARPSHPYVCVGYHRDLAEVDRDYCRRHGLPVYRRMVGGGPVYLDAGQLFFQITLPATAVSPSRVEALRVLLAPAVTAFQAAGVDARLDDDGEICVGDRKICGHGAGQIEDAVVVCGNLIERFDHERAVGVLALPDDEQRAQTLDLMRRYVSATPVDPERFRAAMTAAYAGALGLAPAPGNLTGAERARLAGLDERFSAERWLAGPARPAVARPRQVKVRAGVWTFAAANGQAWVAASVVRDVVTAARLHAPGLNGAAVAVQRAVTGVPLAHVPDVLAGFGEPGRQLAAAFAAADGKRI